MNDREGMQFLKYHQQFGSDLLDGDGIQTLVCVGEGILRMSCSRVPPEQYSSMRYMLS